MEFRKLPRHRQDFYNSHSRPTSRREFLSLGMIGFAGLAFSNPLQRVFGSEELFDSDSQGPAFITIDCAGGAGLSANFLVGGKGGPQDLLKSYSTLGWNPAKDGWDNRFGLPLAKEGVSRLMAGMIQRMSAEAQANFRMGSLLHTSSDDTGSNPLSAAGLAYTSLSRGKEIRQILGLRSSGSGGNSRLASDPTKAPFVVTNQEGLNSAIGLNDVYSKPGVAERVFRRLIGIQKLQSQGLSGQSSSIFDRSYNEALALASKGVNVDPRRDEDTRTAFGIQENANSSARDTLFASIAYNVITGNSGPGVITIGGCDYHDGTATTGDNKDQEIGETIGRIVELAHRKKKAVFIQVITDGGVDAVAGTRRWRGDSGERSMSAIGYYNPNGPSEYRSSQSMQIGHYNRSESADRSTLIGANPRLAGYAAFANYLHVAGRIGDFQTIAPGLFSSAQLESVLIFG